MKTKKEKTEGKITITKDGPYLVSGGLPLGKDIIVSNDAGDSIGWKRGEQHPNKESYSLCRCGKSSSIPYCDGTHTDIAFDGTETASRKRFAEQASETKGPGLNLKDAEGLCATARFCHGREGRVWELTQESDDPKKKEIAIRQACNCPAGRLVACDKKTGKAIEPHHEPSIGLIEDPAAKVSGPIWVKGNVPVESSDGSRYETRNRVTLCRCGKSANKPFCDGAHIDAGYNDGDESLEEK